MPKWQAIIEQKTLFKLSELQFFIRKIKLEDQELISLEIAKLSSLSLEAYQELVKENINLFSKLTGQTPSNNDLGTIFKHKHNQFNSIIISIRIKFYINNYYHYQMK